MAASKPDPSQLTTGTLPFDEDAYNNALPYFQQAWADTKAAGASLGEFVNLMADALVDQAGWDPKPVRRMIRRFAREEIRKQREQDAGTDEPDGEGSEDATEGGSPTVDDGGVTGERWTPLESALEAARWADGGWEIVDALLEGGADPIPYDRDSLLSDDNLRDCFAEVLVRAKVRWLEQQRDQKWDPLDERARSRRRNDARKEARQAVELYEQLRERSGRTHEQAIALVYGHLCPGDAPPLHQVVYENDLAAIDALLKAGADPDENYRSGKTSLQIAVDSANVALPVLMTLLAAGADPDARGSGETPLSLAVSRKNLAAITVLLNAGANPNSYFRSDGSLLHAAVQERTDLAVVAALLNGGADPNAQDEWGKTPLHYAAASTSPVEDTLLVVELLLKTGADPGVEDWHSGWDPVQEADHNEHVEDNQKIVTALLEGGLFPTVRS